MSKYLFTSESVAPGHPDKTCDILSDSLLDFCLSKESDARCAFECFATTDTVVVGGEIRLKNHDISSDDVEQIVRNTLKEIGHNNEGFAHDTVKIYNHIHTQSQEIANGVDENDAKEEGAGDQGIMFGFACRETSELMPAPIFYSHRILQNLSGIEGLGPDAKSQVTFEYENGLPKAVESVVVSTQHGQNVSLEEVRQKVTSILEATLPNMPSKHKTFINPAGTFIIGGPVADTGLTGRKIIVDTYGGSAPHGGGAFSGKDPTKVDRSAAYIARYLAKNIVHAELATHCTIQLSYAIGVAQPVSIYIKTDGESKVKNADIIDFITQKIDLTPKGIRNRLKMNNPIYKPTASFGHFGREAIPQSNLFLWEETNLYNDLKQWFNL